MPGSAKVSLDTGGADLLLAGGAAPVWIAWRLLLPEQGEAGSHHPVATTFWGAMRTIVIADAVMGLDNVMAVAGAAHGDHGLVVAGLVISVAIVIWGSTLVLEVVERFPVVVYLGAGVLVATAVKMLGSEPWLAPFWATAPGFRPLLWVLVPALLWAAVLRKHRVLASRIHHRLTEFAQQRPATAANRRTQADAGEKTMLDVLVPVDGTTNALGAVRHALRGYQQRTTACACTC